jgi:hypothetical protein
MAELGGHALIVDGNTARIRALGRWLAPAGIAATLLLPRVAWAVFDIVPILNCVDVRAHRCFGTMGDGSGPLCGTDADCSQLCNTAGGKCASNDQHACVMDSDCTDVRCRPAETSAYFGYFNPNVDPVVVSYGFDNGFSPAPVI